MFRRFLVILLVVFLLGLLVAGLLLVWAYHSSQQAPEFYRQALKIEPAKAAERSDRMLAAGDRPGQRAEERSPSGTRSLRPTRSTAGWR